MQTHILSILAGLLLTLTTASAQFGNVYVSHQRVLVSPDGQDFLMMNFGDSLPKPIIIGSMRSLSLTSSQDYKFYSNNQGNLTAYGFLFYGNDGFAKQHIFQWPSHVAYVPNGKRNVFLNFLPRDDSTFWILENDTFNYKTYNFQTGAVTQLDTSQFGNRYYTGFDLFFNHLDGHWCLELLNDLSSSEKPRFSAFFLDKEGIQDTVLGLPIDSIREIRSNIKDRNGKLAWNEQRQQVAWTIGKREEGPKDFYTSHIQLLISDFNTNTGRLGATRLLRSDTIQYKEPWREPWVTVKSNYQTKSVAFSNNGKFLYLLEEKPSEQGDNFISRLIQYDLKTGTQVILLDPQSNFLDSTNLSRGLYSAPNGKIYVFPNDRNYPDRAIYVIDYPDNKGRACGVHEVYRTSGQIQRSYTPNYYGKRVHIGQSDGCTPQHRFVNAGDKSFTHLRWHIMDTDSNVLHTLRGDSVKCPPLATGPYLVLLRGEDDNGFVNWHWDSIYYSPPVEAKIALLDSVACEYNSVQFADSSTNAGPTDSLSWKWDFLLNGQILERSDEQHPSLSFSQEGRYSVSLHFSNGICADTATLNKALVVNDGPKPGFALSDTLACAPARIVLTDSSRGAMVSRSFTWSDGFMASTNHERKLTEPALLKVVQRVEGPNGCVSQDSQTLRIRSGIAQLGRPELVSATVLKPGAVQVRWEPLQQAMGYQLWRLQETPTQQELLMENATVTSYLDSQVLTDQQSYQYLLKPIDSCQNVGYPSNLATSLLLHAENQHNRVIILRWNAYETWQNGVKEYVVESSENMAEWLPIDASGQLIYPDYRVNALALDTIYYRIKAVEQEGNMQVSTSNVVQVPLTTTLWVPNAFSPNGDGINDLFKVGQFGIKNFHCTIFGRNGQVVAVSQNPDAVWDGMLRDQPAPAGVYQYIIAAVDEKGEELKSAGTITLIR